MTTGNYQHPSYKQRAASNDTPYLGTSYDDCVGGIPLYSTRDAEFQNNKKIKPINQRRANTQAVEMSTTSLRSALAYAANLFSQVPFLPSISNPFDSAVDSGYQEVPSYLPYTGDVTPYEPLSGAPSCPINGPLSCRNNTPVAGEQSCCFVYPGGRILLTQFWDRDVHAGGTEEDWTLHGLW